MTDSMRGAASRGVRRTDGLLLRESYLAYELFNTGIDNLIGQRRGMAKKVDEYDTRTTARDLSTAPGMPSGLLCSTKHIHRRDPMV